MTVLITGFEPFGPVAHNPSEALLGLLPVHLEGRPLRAAVLPVDADAIEGALEAAYACRPQVALHLGVARERALLSVERVARNRLGFTIPDNAGRILRDQPVEAGAPERLATRLPVSDILAAWRQLDVPCAPSDDAGLYLCNQAFFLALRKLPASVVTGFLHLAPDETMAPAAPHVPLAQQAAAVLAAARVSLEAAREGAAA